MSANKVGSLKLIIGPMFAGKSQEMVREIERHRIAKKHVLIIRHTSDTRYQKQEDDRGMMLNSGQLYDKAQNIWVSTLADAKIQVSLHDVIGISETQFFPDIEWIDKWANDGKIVICEGLSGNTERMAFGRILELIPKAEEVIKLKAVCEICCADASSTLFRDKKTPAGIKVGGAEAYYPVCRSCYLSETKSQ